MLDRKATLGQLLGDVGSMAALRLRLRAHDRDALPVAGTLLGVVDHSGAFSRSGPEECGVAEPCAVSDIARS